MNKIVLILISLLWVIGSQAQVINFNEGFENLPLKVTSSSPTTHWVRSSSLAATGIYSDSARVLTPYSQARLTTDTFSVNSTYAYLEFSHICKIEFADSAYLEISADSGQTWIRLTQAQYLGSGIFGSIGNKFNAASYTQVWVPANPNAIPTNQWWRKEIFDISSLVGNASHVKVRFTLSDGNGNAGAGNYGWLIDNIKVTSSNSELIAPLIVMNLPLLRDSTYSTGPYNIFATITDISGIASAKVMYTVNGNIDTVNMVYQGSNVFKGVIPSFPYNTTFCYKVEAKDSSANTNISNEPSLGCTSVLVKRDPALGIPQHYDAAVHSIESPSLVVLVADTVPISLRIANKGDSTLVKATVEWSLDNVYQYDSVWTGSLSLDLVSGIFQIGSQSFGLGAHKIKMWTKNPNDLNDQKKTNDTLSINIYGCPTQLSGNYTVGAFGADFTDFEDFRGVLHNCGLVGPTTLKFMPGTYTDKMWFTDSIKGLSAVNTLTITSTTGNAEDVIFTANSNFVVRLEKVENVTIKNVSIKNTSISSNSSALLLGPLSKHNNIDGCYLETPFGNYNNFTIYENSGKTDSNIFSNNTIKGGFYGMYLYSNSSTTSYRNIIRNNHFIDYYRTGLYMNYHYDVVVYQNRFDRSLVAGSPLLTSIYSYYCVSLNISHNESVINSDGASYGIYLENSSGTVSRPSRVFNNISMVFGSSISQSYYAFHVHSTSKIEIYNNTFYCNSGGVNSGTVYGQNMSTASNVRFVNNIFVSEGGNPAFYFPNGVVSIDSMDYNLFWSNGGSALRWDGNFIPKSGGIAAIKTATNRNVNSVLVAPAFYGNLDKRTYSNVNDNEGLAISWITDDIDNKPRHATNPSIGAFEYKVIQQDAGVVAILKPLAIDTQNRVVIVEAIVKNYGLSAITNLTVGYRLNNGTPVTSTHTINLAPNTTDTLVVGSLTLPVFDYDLAVFTSQASDTNTFNDTLHSQLYARPLVDLKIVELVTPFNSCDKTVADSVTIAIANLGVGNISSVISASYRINANSLVTESITSGLASGDTLEFTFSTKANLLSGINDTVYHFTFAVNHSLDANNLNDSLQLGVVSMAPTMTPLINDTTINYGSSIVLHATANKPIEWYNSATATNVLAFGANYTTPQLFDTTTYWVRTNANNPPAEAIVGHGTEGPSSSWDFTVYGGNGSAGKYQVLLLASELTAAGLIPGPINSISFQTVGSFTAPGNFEIYLGHTTQNSLTANYISTPMTQVFNGSFVGVSGWNEHITNGAFIWNGTSNIVVQVCASGISIFSPYVVHTLTTFDSYTAAAGFGTSCSMSSGVVYNKRPNVRLKKYGSIGCNSPRTDVVVSVPFPQLDAKMHAILSPSTGCGLAQSQVKVQLVNKGLDTLNAGLPLTYKINNGSFITPEFTTQAIFPTDTLEFTFATQAALPSGANYTNYTLTVKAALASDDYHANDSLVSEIIRSYYTPADPILTSPISLVYGNKATLTATANDTIFWYAQSGDVAYLHRGVPYQTNFLYDTTTFYAASRKSTNPSTHQIGTSNTYNPTDPSPYGSNTQGARHQFLYKASDLAALGLSQGFITSISFYAELVKGNLMHDFTIKMGNTKYTDLDTTLFANNLTTVLGPVNFFESYGWNQHNFTTPFYWDGVSNIIIETSFKGEAILDFVGVNYTVTTDISVAQSKGNALFDINSPYILSTSKNRPNLKFTIEGSGVCQSNYIPLTVNVNTYPAKDAALLSVTAPINLIESVTPTPVKVVLKNFGLNNLTAATINWKENGASQTPFSWTGNLAHGQVDTVVIAPSHSFLGGLTTIKSWVTTTGDITGTNDTITSSVKVSLNGLYHIGAVNRRYATITAAVNDLKLCGISGPVIMSLDSGNYYEKMDLTPIAGSSSVNPITFISLDSNAGNVHISQNTYVGNNYVIRMNGAKNFNFRYLNISANGAQYGDVFLLYGGAANINIENNHISSSVTSVNNSVASALHIMDTLVRMVNFKNNLVYNGYKAIAIERPAGSTTPVRRARNITIDNNEFHDFIKYGMYAYYADSIYFTNNYLSSTAMSIQVYGIFCYYVYNGFNFSKNIMNLRSAESCYGIYGSVEGTVTNRGLISNNMINILAGNGSNYGTNILPKNTDLLYNTISMKAGNVTAAVCYYLQAGSLNSFMNNIASTQAGYALHLASPNSYPDMDYNNFFTLPGTTLFAKWGSNNIANLAALQAQDNGKNMNSMTLNPHFLGTEDLHAQSLQMYNKGIPQSRVTSDIDGNLRGTTYTSPGADEYTPPAIDLGVVAVTAPNAQNCGLTTSEQIEVGVYNYGLNNINFATTPATLTLYIDGVVQDTLVFVVNSGVVNSEDTIEISLTSNYDLSTLGAYVMIGDVQIASDGNAANNTSATFSIESFPIINTFPFNENFETGKNISFRHSAGFDSQVGVNSFAGNSSNYGLQFQGGSYSNWSATNPTTVQAAFAISSKHTKAYSCSVDATTQSHLNLKFDLRQTASSMASVNYNSWFRVLAVDAFGTTHYLKNLNGDSVFKPVLESVDPFQSHTFYLDQFVGQTFSISFEAINHNAYGYNGGSGDNALLDNITIWTPNPVDVSVNAIINTKGYGHVGELRPIKVAIENFGTDTIFEVPLAYKANNLVVRDTSFIVIPPLYRDTFTFAQDLSLQLGAFKVVAYSELSTDLVLDNDTTEALFKGLKTFYPTYFDKFEGSDEFYPAGSFTQFERGTPSTPNINSAYSGVNAWVTNLNGNYSTGAVEYLYTPYYTILPYTDSLTVDFWQKMRTTSNQAFGTFEYSFDGINWASIGYIGYPGAQNWYNVNQNGKHRWNMMNNTWINSKIKLDPSIFNTGNEVQFRFVFEAWNSNYPNEGWAIDNFKLYFPPRNQDAGITEIVTPIDTIKRGTTQWVKVNLRNFGSDTLTSIPLRYQVNAFAPVNETFTGTLLPDSTTEFTFAVPFFANQNVNSICVKTLLTTDQQSINDQNCKTLVCEKVQMDLGVSSIAAPYMHTPIVGNNTVKVYVTNFGLDTLYSTPVQYFLNNILTATETLNATLIPGDSILYTFSQTYLSPLGNYSLYAKSNLSGDGYHLNDSTFVLLLTTAINTIEKNGFAVAQNQPNPAIESTVVEYELPKNGTMNVQITEVGGKLLQNWSFSEIAGKHKFEINTQNMAAGIYYYSFIFEGETITHKMSVVK